MNEFQYSEQERKLIEECSIAVGVYQYIDKRVVALALSDGFRELLGVKTLEEAYSYMNKDMYRDTHPDDVAAIADAAVRFAEKGGEYNVIYRARKGDDYIIVHAIGKHIYKPTGERLAVVNYVNEGVYENTADVAAELKKSQKNSIDGRAVTNKTSYDVLTGLPDMNYFFEMAEQRYIRAHENKERLAMIFLDLSGMKAFNQRYGYTEGDLLLKEIARTLVHYFSNENCCRVTADHFAIYTERDVLRDNLSSLVKELKQINGGKTLPVRIGIYDTMLGHVKATTACDRAKIACDSLGDVYENTVQYFNMNMLKQYENRRYVFENLDKAISEGWIKVFYQPIVRAANGKVSDEEALARWEDPERGIMPPADFIPILEDAKISYKLDLYVLEQVIEKLKYQAENGLYVVPNSINLSRTDFWACDMVEEIRRRVDESGTDRDKITIEITESVVVEDIDFIKIQVDRFRKLGFRVWMDDFGSGYSSPDILQKIHFDVVKIDKAFVDQIEENEGCRVIMTELVRLANGLGSETVAEGVENEKQVEFLKEIGCTRLQGFYYCHAIHLEKIIERNRKGLQIGFENPAESEYYSMVGNVNLYDMSFSYEDSEEDFRNYFNTMPMFIIEVGEKNIRLSRGNKSYREFMTRYYPDLFGKGKAEHTIVENGVGSVFCNAVIQCKNDGKRQIIDVRTKNGDVVHLFMRRIAINPVNGRVALELVVLGCANNDAELKHKEALERIRQERRTYARISALSGDYIVLYTVDPETDHYVELSATDDYRSFGLANEGDDFYGQSRRNGSRTVCIDDIDLFLSMFTKENVMKEIEKKGVFSMNYRLIVDGIPKYVCLKAAIVEEESGPQVIVGIIDTDAQVKKDQEYSQKLMAARDIANLDILTGVKNKYAYVDAETQLNKLIEEGTAPEFAVVVFDLNGLKEINDKYGHQAGDRFIKEGCDCICRTFRHSPVFRVGGDEFAVIAQGGDFKNIDKLMDIMHQESLKNRKSGKVVIAAGMSRFSGDRSVSTVFERADTKMYDNKHKLKEQKEEKN